jgi:transposase
MDLSSGSQDHRAGVWRAIPSGTGEPYSQRAELDTPKAHSASQATSGSGDPALERRTLARVEKKAAEEERTIIFIDESGVYWLPIVVRTYAPCGRTPILKEFLSYDHLSLIGAVTPQGRLFLKTYEHSITSQEVIAFLAQLLRLIPGLLLVIWDGSPTHRSKVIRTYLAAGAAKRIHLEQLPGYAPELNPTEWVWSYLKIADLANVACDFLSEWDVIIQKAKKRMHRKPDLIQAFILDAGYEV